MTGFVPFDGELDAPAAVPKAGFVPFTGELDAAPEPVEPTGDPMGAGDGAAIMAQPARDAGGGRGFVNPPADGVPKRDVGVLESAGRGWGKAGAQSAQAANLAVAASGVVYDKLHSLISGKLQTGAQDAMFNSLVDPTQEAVDWYALKPDEQQSFLGKVGEAVGAMAQDLPQMIASGGAAQREQLVQQFPTMARFLENTVSQGFDAMRTVMVRAGTEKAKQVLDAGGSVEQAVNSATTAAMVSGFQGGQPMSATGSLARRVATGLPVGAVQGEAAREIQNAADPTALHRDFDPADATAGAVTNAMAAGAMGHHAPGKTPDRIELGYDPTAGKTPVADAVQGMGEPVARFEPGKAETARDPVGAIFRTGSVEEAAAAAERAAGPSPADEMRAARPLRPVEAEGVPNDSASGDVSGLAPGARGERGAEPGAGGGDGNGAERVSRLPVDTAGRGGQAETDAAPVADGRSADAVEPFATKPEANMAGLKEDAVAVPAEGGWALQLKTRPYSERERVEAQGDVARLNEGLEYSNKAREAAGLPAGDEPVRLLQGAPTPTMVVGRRIGRLLGVKVVFVEDHPGFSGVSLEGVAYVSPQAKHPELAITGHEVLHGVLQQLRASDPARAQQLQEQVSAYLKREAVDKKQEREPDRSRAHAEEEAIADLNGAMWMDPKFWAEMRKNDPSTFRKVAYAFLQAIAHVTKNLSRFKAEDFVTDVDAVRKILAREMAQLAREEAVESHSAREKEEMGLRADDAKVRGTTPAVATDKTVAGTNEGGRSAGDSTTGTDKNTGLPLNADGTVTLYHHTSKDSAAAIRKTGTLKAAAEPDVYLTTRRETDTGYGDTAVPLRVDPAKLQIDDEFPDGRKDFRLHVGKPGGSIKVAIANEHSASVGSDAPQFSIREDPENLVPAKRFLVVHTATDTTVGRAETRDAAQAIIDARGHGDLLSVKEKPETPTRPDKRTIVMFDRDKPADERKPGTVTRDEARQMGDLRKKVKVLESLLGCLQ